MVIDNGWNVATSAGLIISGELRRTRTFTETEVSRGIVRGLWIIAWRHLVSPFMSSLPVGLAEMFMVATMAMVVALISSMPYVRRLVIVSLLGPWVALLTSLALTLARR